MRAHSHSGIGAHGKGKGHLAAAPGLPNPGGAGGPEDRVVGYEAFFRARARPPALPSVRSPGESMKQVLSWNTGRQPDSPFFALHRSSE